MEVAKSNRSNTLGGAKSLKCDSRPLGTSDKSTKKAAQQRSFLTTRFNPIPIFDIVPDKISRLNIEDGDRLILGGQEIEITSNLKYLRECAESYCKVHGGTIPPLNPHPLRELHLLYGAVSDCCPKDNLIEINFDGEMNRLVFVELAYVSYPDSSLVFFSVRFLDLLPPEYRTFFLQVLSLVRVTMGVPFPEDHFDLAYATGYFDEDYVREEMEEDEEYGKYVKSYIDGKAADLFKEIYHSPWIELDKSEPQTLAYIKRLIDDAPSEELARFVDVAADGIELMSRQVLSKLRFNVGQCNIPEFDNQPDDCEIFSIERIMAFCYGEEDDDPVVERAVAGINCEAGNLCQEELYDPCMITPEYSTPFIPTDFPNRFFEWFVKFYQAQMKYEQTHRNNVGDVQSQDGDHCL